MRPKGSLAGRVLIPALLGLAAGVAMNLLFTALVLSIERVPEGAGDLLLSVSMLLACGIAPVTAGIVGAGVSTATAARRDGQPAGSLEQQPSTDTAPVLAGVLGGGATLLLAVAMLFAPLLVGSFASP